MPLDRDTVVLTALRLLDSVGLDGLTLRKIAGELRWDRQRTLFGELLNGRG